MSNGHGPTSLTDWVRYLHNAAQVRSDSPDYGEARDAIQQALRHIHALNVGATMTEANAAEKVGTVPALAGALLHGASLGTGELFSADPESYREALGTLEASHPKLTALGETAGTLAVPAPGVGEALSGVEAGVPLTIRQLAGRIGRGALAGAVPGAVLGVSAGGANPNDLRARLRAGGQGAVVGALLGGAATGAGFKLVRNHLERYADLANRGVMRRLERERAAYLKNAMARRGEPSSEGLATEMPPVGTSEERAVARALGIPVEQIRGRVGERATPPTTASTLSAADAAAIEARRAAATAAREAPRATQLPIRGDVSAGAAPDALRTALLDQMAHPMAHTPPFEQSAAAPGVIEAQASRAIRRALATPGPISTRIVRSDLAGELPERRPFSGAPEGGVQQVAYPGRSPVDIPLDPGLAETMLGPVGEPGKGEPLLPQRGVLERPLPVAPGEFPERPVVGEPGALIQNRFNAAIPLSRLGKGKTLPYYPRGGKAEQALPPPPVRSGPAGALRNTPYADLRIALADPKIPLALRQAIRQELGRRGIAGFP